MFRAAGSGLYPMFRSVSGVFQDLDPVSHESWITTELIDTNHAVQYLNFNASRSSSIYANNATVRPQSLSVLVLLRL